MNESTTSESVEENGEQVAPAAVTSNTFRTQQLTIIAYPWSCAACKHKGLMFDPNKVKELVEHGRSMLECPECKSIIRLETSSILAPDQVNTLKHIQGVRNAR